MALGGFIGAMLEPCETKGQAVLTSVCLLVLATGLFAISYPLYHLGNNARADMIEYRESRDDSTYVRSRQQNDGFNQIMIYGYGGVLIFGGLGTLSVIGAIVIPVRSLFPNEFSKREEEPR
jgi:hypothetical protein